LINSQEALASASTLTHQDSGKHFLLNLAGGFTTTLPSPKAGWKARFTVKTAPTTAYIIVTASSANIVEGGVGSGEDASGSVACVSNADTITFVANKAVAGDYIELESDGTSFFINGNVLVQDGLTTTQAS